MKISVLLLFVLLSFSACQKVSGVKPTTGKSNTKGNDTTNTNPDTSILKPDSLPDNAAFRLRLNKTDADYDETLFMFNRSASLNYVANEDAAFLQGFGDLSLASLSADGKDLSINGLPYTQGMSICLDVQAKDDGAYSLQMSYENKIPANIKVWVKDVYSNDSVNICNANYSFTVSKADTTSFGNKRFKLIIR